MSNFWGLFLFEKKYLKNKLFFGIFILFFSVMKKYLSLIGVTALILAIGWLWYQALFAYLAEHTYYFGMLSSGQNWWVFISALLCAWLFPLLYLLAGSKIKIKNLLIAFVLWAWIFGVIHSNIKWDPIWIWHVITIFNTILLVCLWIYLILWFSALWSWIERKWIKFKQFRWQEMFLSFWIWFCSFVIIVQILLWIWLLYWIVSWLLFLWLGFMVRYERESLWKREEIICGILNNYREWLLSWEWNLNSKKFWNSKKIWFIAISLPTILSLAYLYMWIQNAFVPYSTAWDANHEYMYTPKILAENAGIYWWNTLANTMPWFWHQFLTFIFSLTWCTNWWFGLSPDNIAISMNNISATLVLLFWIAIIFQIFSLINNKKDKDEESEMKKWKNMVIETEMENWNWITMWWYILLLWLTWWMWAFLVIVDNKTDLWVMALSLLALLAGLIFLQNRKNSKDKRDLFKYVLIAGLFFGFAALAKITAFVDLVLFWLLLVWLRFSSLTSLWLWIMVMWFVRKFNILTSSVMLTDTNATWLIIVWWIITITWLIVYLLKRTNRKEFWKNFKDLIILWIWFLLPLIVLKLPRTIISQIKTDNFSFWNSLKSVFLSMDDSDKNKDYSSFLAQNIENEEVDDGDGVSDSDVINSLDEQELVDTSKLNLRNDKTFAQCSAAGDIYSEEELNEWLEEIVGWQWWEDFWRYIWYWRKEFKKANLLSIDEDTANKSWFKFFKSLRPKSRDCGDNDANNIICDKNLSFGIMKLFWPTSDKCYGFNHDAKILCENANVIDSFKIDDLRAIYENWINNKEWEAWLLLKQAIDAYDEAKSEGKIWFSSSNSALFHDEIVNLRQYYQSHSIASTEGTVNIPYRYLVPLNISFNWSLQNLSSYYTDIGFFWIIIYVCLLIALPYAIVKKDKILTSIALTTLIWWGIWWIIWSSILWYWTVLISRTMITLALLWSHLFDKKEKNLKVLPYILIVIVALFFWIQILFNFLRISSQWANSVFVRYKWNVGREQIISEELQPANKVKYWYNRKSIFDLQFPQYNPIIHALADREDKDWVIIAWTYIQYFLWNQRNIKWDWMLSDFWKKTSDWDLCKIYWRLKKDNVRYLIVDPNIGTVTMWEWNETLFYRFFWKLGENGTKIEKDGTILSLIRLAKEWYIKLLSTNNVGSKYAFTLTDDEIRWYFWWNLTDDELILKRGKMAVLQYFNDADSIFWTIANIFINRIMNDREKWIEDIANIYWMEVDTKKIASAADSYINWNHNWNIDNLSQNERAVLVNYLNIYMAYSQWQTENWQAMIQNLLINSVSWWSQVIALELN